MAQYDRNPMEATTCRKCNALILWCVTANNARMPINAEPQKGMILEVKEGAQGLELHGTMGATYQSHFVTCPAANEMRKPRERKPRRDWNDGGGR